MERDKTIEIVPALLSKTEQDLKAKISSVDFVPILQIDLMDGRFVPEKTVGLESCRLLPHEKIIEYHLMVQEPILWMEALSGGESSIFQIHVESCDEDEMGVVRECAKSKRSKLCWALNPSTPAERIERNMDYIDELLVMTVHPGRSGQVYLEDMGEKIRALRREYPDIIIEVDGGVNEKTIPHAVGCGATRLAAASALFAKEDVFGAYKNLKRIANGAEIDSNGV